MHFSYVTQHKFRLIIVGGGGGGGGDNVTKWRVCLLVVTCMYMKHGAIAALCSIEDMMYTCGPCAYRMMIRMNNVIY